MMGGTFTKRRSRKRFQDIPPLPQNLAVNDGGSITLRRYEPGAITYDDAGAERNQGQPNALHDGTERLEADSGDEGELLLEEPTADTTGPERVTFNAAPEVTVSENEDGFEARLEDWDLSESGEECVPGHRIESRQVAEHDLYEAENFKTQIKDWRVIWGVLMTSGSQRVTRDQYESMRSYLEASANVVDTTMSLCNKKSLKQIMQVPHYSTVQKRVKPIILNMLGPRADEQFVPVDVTKAGARIKSRATSGIPQTAVRIVLPSEYARADVSTPEVFAAMRETSLSQAVQACPLADSSNTFCIDTVPLIYAREWFYGPPSSVSVDISDSVGAHSAIAEEGDVVRISFLGPVELEERIDRCFGVRVSDSMCVNVLGEIQHIWSVHHRKRRNEPEFCSEMPLHLSKRDKEIIKGLNFATYKTPTDSVSVFVPQVPVDPELPEDSAIEGEPAQKRRKKSPEYVKALKQRRKAIAEKRAAEEKAWENWKKPLTKPGDVIALLRPARCSSSAGILTETDRQSRVCVVFRFWTEMEERGRHLIWIPGGTELPESENTCAFDLESDSSLESRICRGVTVDGRQYLYVRSIALSAVHGSRRGPEKFRPMGSIGVLSTGEDYFVYRFVLYWDGFEVQHGKKATGEGIYLLCLNLPVRARSDPSAVRIISLTPPGVKSITVLERIIDDLVEGMTTGFVDYDACGTRRRIFLDLVGILGDTPALNSVLDTLGHTGASCCHLCNIVRRSRTMIGSRYTSESHSGSETAFRRSIYRHLAVRDCEAQKDACRGLGMRAVPDTGNLILHRMRAKMLAVKDNIPKTSEGSSIVPCALDPYRACFVAPDHVLTGHVRDCINLVFRLLPSHEHRSTCEKFMLSMLESCGLPKQNRLLDQENKGLYSMSMSDMYALSLVAEISFRKGISYHNLNRSTISAPSEKCRSAIELVGSAARLVSELWYIACMDRDGAREVRAFNGNGRTEVLKRIQAHASNHVSLLEKICCFQDCHYDALEDPCTPASQKVALTKIRNACIIAIRTVDKPNVHRIMELVNTTLPMLGHVSVFGELVLEKSHQKLKRALKKSNNRDAHLQAMASVVISDWQGRLSGSAPYAVTGDENATRACFRLLSGRESVISLQGKLQKMHEEQVLQALGPENCAVRELQKQKTSVISRRYRLGSAGRWELRGAVEKVIAENSVRSHYRKEALSYLKDACPVRWTTMNVSISDSVTLSIAPGIAGHHFKRGDVIQLLSRYCKTPECHFPFVAQGGESESAEGIDFGPSLWCVHSIISAKNELRKDKIMMALLPCVLEKEQRSVDTTYRVNTSGPISFATLDSSTRLVPSVHDCEGSDCVPDSFHHFVRHSWPSEPLDGAAFIPLTAKMGYPPRMG